MPKQNDDDYLNNEANLSIYADHLGLTPQYVRDNKLKLKNIEDQIKQSLISINKDDNTVVYNTINALQNITRRTYISDGYDSNLDVGQNHLGTITSNSGFKMMYGETENRDESEIFQFNASLFSSYRNLVSEYRNISRLINVVNRCADMKSRDILAINEITKRSVANVYQPKHNDKNKNLPTALVQDPINKQIQEEILDKYNIEERLPRYICTSLIEGAKPVVVYPYKDIIQMAEYNMNIYRRKFTDFNARMNAFEKSNESLSDIMLDYHERNQQIVDERKQMKFNVLGMEDLKTDDEYKTYRDKIIEKYVSAEDFKEYCDRGLEDFNDYVNLSEKNEMASIYSSNVNNKTELINEAKEKYKKYHESVRLTDIMKDMNDTFKDQIYNAIKTIDLNIEYFDESDASMAVGINNFRRLMQFTAYHEDPQNGLIALNATLQNDKKLKSNIPYYDQDNPDTKLAKTPKSVFDEFNEDLSENTNNLLNGCIIKEYDAEDVIPIIVSGKHVGYYVLEMSPYTGNSESINKRNCNFTDMFINMGMSNDLALSPSPTTTGTFSSGVHTMPLGGAGPTSEVSGIGVMGNGSIAVNGGMDMTGYELGPAGADATHRNNIMKKIMFNILKDKLKNKNLEDDETFVDTVMSLIRDGAIVQNRVKIIYVPEKYMCYFTPGIDGNGIPQSFMKNVLFTCYERVLVDMNNIMTRLTRTGTRDKLTINIGKAKNMGYSIRSIENALTTRRLNVESPFTSLSRVLKASSLSETIIVPSFEGEKLFEYEDLTKTNEAQPNDDLLQKLDNEIVTALNCPITITNPYQEEDFASLAASRNAEYRLDLIKHQNTYSKTICKLIKQLIVGTGLYETIKKSNENFSLKDIKVTLAAPQSLNMKNANELFSTIQTYIDNIISIIFNPDDNNESTNITRWKFKQKLYQKYMPGIDLEEYLNDVKNLEGEGKLSAIKQKISDSVNKNIVNTDFDPIVATPDGQVLEAGHSGVSENNDADMGSW